MIDNPTCAAWTNCCGSKSGRRFRLVFNRLAVTMTCGLLWISPAHAADPSARDAGRPTTSESNTHGDSGKSGSRVKAASPGKPVHIPSPEELFRTSIEFSARKGARWLQGCRRQDGLFVYGWEPALNRPLPDDNLLRQAGATAALARAAAQLKDDGMILAAGETIFVLLGTYTELDSANPKIRKPTVQPAEANPVGFAGLLLLAISEMPNPPAVLIEQEEQLARFLVSRQRPDGSLIIATAIDDDGHDPLEAIDYYPGEALYALMRSHARRPAEFKMAAVKKAFEFYRKHWKQAPSAAFVPWQTATYAELYLATGESAYADFVFEMNDWLARLQYFDTTRSTKEWIGGFGSEQNGRMLPTPPGASTGSFAESLADAYRAARRAKDLKRMADYKYRLEMALKFLAANQYTVSGATHMAEWYARKLAGAFHASVHDGSVRIDYTQHATCAMLHYLAHVTEPSAAVPPTAITNDRKPTLEPPRAN